LQKAGVSENQLKDRRTRDFIYSFIESNNVEELMRNETKTKTTAPPVPSRHQNQNNYHQQSNHGEKMRIAPAPPPPPKDFPDSRNERRERPPAPPLPQTTPPITQKVIRSTPQRPAPTHQNSHQRDIQNIPPPPPPAPPMNMMVLVKVFNILFQRFLISFMFQTAATTSSTSSLYK
jgi:neural Wiskott-Aldrich syndrome protein